MNSDRKRGRPAHPDILTPGEWRVAKAARFGMTNRQIAERFDIGLEAVKFHLSNILSKLGFDRRQELANWPEMPVMSDKDGEIDVSTSSGRRSDDGPIIPPGFTCVFPYLFVEGARDYLRFLDEGLGGEIIDIHAAPNGDILNAHIRFGDTTIMVSEARGGQPPSRTSLYLYVADAADAMARGVAAGGSEISPVGFRPYGEHQGGLKDPAGNIWWLSQRLAPGSY